MRIINKLIINLILICLTSCSSKLQQDGAPSHDIDLNQIVDAKPKPEPRSRYGNPQHYSVRGQQYRVLQHAEHFKQSGLASWYGTKFHGRLTSNREYYNMMAMTAAHRTLPLPCYVRVTRQDNGESVIVRVNDRGPFVNTHERIIDLSYAAAKKLHMLGTGTTRVTIEVIASQPSGAQWLQLGAYQNIENAKSRFKFIRQQLNLNVQMTQHNQWYRLKLGPFQDTRQAASAIAKLNQQHIPYLWVS